MERLWGVPEAARYLGCCRETVRRLIREGRISAVRVGGSYRMTRKSIDRDLSLATWDGGEERGEP